MHIIYRACMYECVYIYLCTHMYTHIHRQSRECLGHRRKDTPGTGHVFVKRVLSA